MKNVFLNGKAGTSSAPGNTLSATLRGKNDILMRLDKIRQKTKNNKNYQGHLKYEFAFTIVIYVLLKIILFYF